MRRLAGLVCVAVGGVLFAMALLSGFQTFVQAWEANAGDIWLQVQSLAALVWTLLGNPLILVTLGLIALEGK
jgi:hypothetical protein